MSRPIKPTCDGDCFHCQHDDCDSGTFAGGRRTPFEKEQSKTGRKKGMRSDNEKNTNAKSNSSSRRGFGKTLAACTGEDCLNRTRPASKCRGCFSNRKTVYCDTQPTRKPKGKPDKTAVKLCTKEDHA